MVWKIIIRLSGKACGYFYVFSTVGENASKALWEYIQPMCSSLEFFKPRLFHSTLIWRHEAFCAGCQLSERLPLNVLCGCAFVSGAAGCASPRMKTIARQSGCDRADAAAPQSGFTRPACSAGWTRSRGATARRAWHAPSATQNTSLSFPN